MEVRGEKLAEEVGNRVEVTGTAVAAGKPVAGASQVIQVKEPARGGARRVRGGGVLQGVEDAD